MMCRITALLLGLFFWGILGSGCNRREHLSQQEYKDWILDEANGLSKSFVVKNFLLTVTYLPVELQIAEIKPEYKRQTQMNDFHSFVVKVEQKRNEPVVAGAIPFRLNLCDASVSLVQDGSDVNLVFSHKQYMPGNGLNYIFHLFFEKSDSLSNINELHFKVIDPEQKTVLASLEIPKRTLQNLPELKSDNHDN
jgi:hypothetical protein